MKLYVFTTVVNDYWSYVAYTTADLEDAMAYARKNPGKFDLSVVELDKNGRQIRSLSGDALLSEWSRKED